MNKTVTIISYIAYSLTVVAAVLYMPFPKIAPYIMAVGCAALLVLHFMERYEGNNLRLQRNMRSRHLVGVLYAVAAYFMFQPGMYWVLALMVAVMLEIYTLSVMTKEK